MGLPNPRRGQHRNVYIPTIEQFEAAVKEANTMSKWRDLVVGDIYKIIDYKILDTKFGESMKLTVANEGGEKKTVWCPEIVKETFRSQEIEDRKAPYTHIRSNGLKVGRSAKYWSFDVVEIDDSPVSYS